MWFSKRQWSVAVAVAVAAALVLWGVASALHIPQNMSNRLAAQKCDEAGGGEDALNNCYLEIALEYIRAGDILGAYRAFDYLYDSRPVFGAWGCHVNAHRLGDTAYYQFFLTHGLSLEDMDFPQETTSCGYGFFHGFIEHLMQDHPQASYVEKTCEYLRERLSADMRDIAPICYHASGHGFIQAVADTMSKSQWGNVANITRIPLLTCESLKGISDREVEECREGVFNVVSDWMSTKDYGLSVNFERPFTDCDAMEHRWQWACYYEFAMKLEPIVKDDVAAAASYVKSIRNPDLRAMSFGSMVAGMMQRLAPLDEYRRIFDACTRIDDDVLFGVCVRSAANGMMEHGNPGKEYEKILPMCALEELVPRGGTDICYSALANRLSRFYEPEKKKSVCELFPPTHREECMMAP